LTLAQEDLSSLPAEELKTLLAQQVDRNHAELVNQYRQALRQTLFTNRSRVHPSSLESIAVAQVDALLNFLKQAESGVAHGMYLCQTGLSNKTVLQLNQATRRFFIAHLEYENLLPALDLIETYLNEIIKGFIQQLNAITLDEQEQIRSALQVAVSRYVIEIKEVESMASQANEANEFKTQFIARISHELRTPLGALLGMAEMLQQNVYGQLNQKQQDIVQRIINNALVLKQVFSELLDQSQIESGKLKLRNETYSPKQLVETVYTNYLSMALKKGLTMHIEVNPNLPETAQGDAARVQQIISNLVTNAIKYTQIGRVNIRSQRASDSQWMVQIKDTGIGISKKDQEYIFDSFQQVGQSGGWEFGGVGLGLAIVHNLVTAMGGRVTVNSKIGHGSTFTVFLPIEMTQMEEVA
jgi:signal transduction histidine kinase